MVPLHAEYGRVDEVDLCAVLLNDTLEHAFDGGLTGVGIADDAAFADVGATCFELGFDEDDGGAAPWLIGSAERVEDGRKDKGGGDEGDVHRDERRCGCAGDEEFAGGEEAGVGSFAQSDAWIVTELLRDLAVAGVDCEDSGGGALQHAVGEATGGGSDVDTVQAGEVDVPVRESALQFESTTTDVLEIGTEDANDGID